MATRQDIGETIRATRKALGQTQRELSQKCGVHTVNISEIENGKFTGSFDYFERILDALDLQFEVREKAWSPPRWDEIKPEED